MDISSLKNDMNTTNIKDLDPRDLEIDETMFEKAFTQETRADVVESSPQEKSTRRTGRLRLKRPEKQKSRVI